MANKSSREAYATLITSEDFVDGGEVLLHSLKKTGTDRDLIVVVTSDICKTSRQRLSRIAQRICEVEPIANPFERQDASWKGSGYTKLRLWTLVEYRCIVYIDADAVVLSNIDELFFLETHFAAAPDLFPPDKFNAGVLVLRPDLDVFQQMMETVPLAKTHDGGDTGFLNSYFHDWFSYPANARLPFRYNAQRTLFWMTHQKTPGYWNSIKPIKILHFVSSPKPWQDTKSKGEIELIWWQFALDLRSPGGGLAAFLGSDFPSSLAHPPCNNTTQFSTTTDDNRSHAPPACSSSSTATVLDLWEI